MKVMMNYSFTVPSLLILIIIMGYFFLRPRLPIRLNRAFLAILVIDICTVLFDYVSSRLNETWELHAPVWLWLFNLLFFVFYLTRIYMFYVFSVSVLDARGAIRSGLHIYTPAIYFLCAAVALSSPLTGWMFRIDRGYRPGPLYFLLYACAGCYILFSVAATLRGRRRISTYELIGLLGLQAVLLTGNIIRVLLPNFLVMNTFCLMGILVIYLSFQNPDLFLSDRGYVYNLPAFQALSSRQSDLCSGHCCWSGTGGSGPAACCPLRCRITTSTGRSPGDSGWTKRCSRLTAGCGKLFRSAAVSTCATAVTPSPERTGWTWTNWP